MDSFVRGKRIVFPTKQYNVFLSFRGSDIRKTLVDHMLESFAAAGIKVYRVDQTREKGNDIWTSLTKALDDSDIIIPIFSRDYARSPWCLDELVHMWKYKMIIIPLFYHVQPCQIRHAYSQPKAASEANPYSEALEEHQRKGRYLPEIIEEWKQALKEVSNFKGWTTDGEFEFEGRLLKQVVHDVTKKLGKIPFQNLPEYPVQLERKILEVIQKLNIDDKENVLAVGIWGLDGIGKTTIAKAVFNRIFENFEAYCFLSDDSTKCQHKDGLRDLTSRKYRRFHIPDEGRSVMAQFSGLKRTLIVLDNIVDSKQLEILRGQNWAGPGSRMILTTPDKHILNRAQIKEIYKMDGLEHNEALRLFSWRAFSSPEPDARYAQECERIVKACDGLPLAVVAAGDLLHDKTDNPGCWSEALSTPQSICHQKVYDVIKPNYDKLTFQEKKIFVHIACSYVGQKTEQGIRHWKKFNWDAHTVIKNLEFKSLIIIDGDGRLRMQRLVRDMGEAINEAEEPENCCLQIFNRNSISTFRFKYPLHKRLENRD
ncbi:hypothetical protein SUGI_0337200 [Cryptomeria japonica]|nr:hypothetical protein SUGI_0337200 [Cryptomeria japonica]